MGEKQVSQTGGLRTPVPLHELAAFRAVVQGIYVDEAVARYLGPRATKHARAQITRIRQRLIRAALARGWQGEAAVLRRHLARMKPRAGIPTLEAFVAEWDPKGMMSVQEQQAEYESRYPTGRRADPAKPGEQASDPRERLMLRQLKAIARLVNERGELAPESDLGDWLHPSDARRLGSVGVKTPADFAGFRARHGAYWRRRVKGLGAAGEARICAVLGLPEGAQAALPAIALPRLELVPAVRAAGHNRAAAENCAIEAPDDVAAARAWIMSHEAQHTRRACRREADRLIHWAAVELGKPLSGLATEDMHAYWRFLANPGPAWTSPARAKRGTPAWRPFRGPLLPASIKQARRILNGLFTYLLRKGYLRWSPVDRVSGDVARIQVERHITPEAWALFSDWLASRPPGPKSGRLRAIVALLVGVGLRRDELASLTTTGIHEETDKGGKPCGWAAWVRGKGDKLRTVVLLDDVMSTLGDYLESRGLPRDPRKCPPGTPVIAALERVQGGHAHRSAPASDLAIYQSLSRAMKACADEIVAEHPGHAHTLRLVTPHWLRHSFAFEMLAGGASLFAVQAQLGHTSPATTQVYVHLLMQDRQQALRAAAANRARGDKVG